MQRSTSWAAGGRNGSLRDEACRLTPARRQRRPLPGASQLALVERLQAKLERLADGGGHSRSASQGASHQNEGFCTPASKQVSMSPTSNQSWPLRARTSKSIEGFDDPLAPVESALQDLRRIMGTLSSSPDGRWHSEVCCENDAVRLSVAEAGLEGAMKQFNATFTMTMGPPLTPSSKRCSKMTMTEECRSHREGEEKDDPPRRVALHDTFAKCFPSSPKEPVAPGSDMEARVNLRRHKQDTQVHRKRHTAPVTGVPRTPQTRQSKVAMVSPGSASTVAPASPDNESTQTPSTRSDAATTAAWSPIPGSPSRSLASGLSAFAPPVPDAAQLRAAAVAQASAELNALIHTASRAADMVPECAPLAGALRAAAAKELAVIRTDQACLSGVPLSEERISEIREASSQGLKMLNDALEDAVGSSNEQAVIPRSPLQMSHGAEPRTDSGRRSLSVPSLNRVKERVISGSPTELVQEREMCIGASPTAWSPSACSASQQACPDTGLFNSHIASGHRRPVLAKVFRSVAADMQRVISDIRTAKQARMQSTAAHRYLDLAVGPRHLIAAASETLSGDREVVAAAGGA